MGAITPRRLVQRGNDMLVISAQGFLIAYRDRTIDEVVRRLKNFDFEEWYCTLKETSLPELSGICHPLMHDAQRLLEIMSKETRRCLNPELLQLAGTNLHLYNRLQSTNDFHTKARLQAIKVMPLLLWEFQKMTYEIDQLRKRIDAGQSVWEAYQAYYPCKVSLLKRIAKAQHIPEEWYGNLPLLLEALDSVAIEKLPQSAQDWQAFTDIYRGLRLSTEMYDYRRTVKTRWLGEIAKTGWVKSHAKFLALESGVGSLGDTFDFLDELGRAGNWMARNIRQCRKNDNLTEDERYLKHWMRAPDTFGMNRLLDASILWHHAHNNQVASTPKDKNSGETWEPLFSFPVELSKDVLAVTLCSQHDLNHESNHLLHCVRSYASKCYTGYTHIISLRNKYDESLSTIEIVQRNEQWQIVQHRAIGNREPEIKLKELEKPLMQYVEQYADSKLLQDWKEYAAKNNPFSIKKPSFSLKNLSRLCDALGRDRVLGLFVDMSKIQNEAQCQEQVAKRA